MKVSSPKILVIGGGSIGIHLARAWSKIGAAITIVDNDPEALSRLPEIWLNRYGSTVPTNVRQMLVDHNHQQDFDLVAIGTPPETHVDLVRLCLDSYENALIQIQKPVCGPDIEDLKALFAMTRPKESSSLRLIGGFNHRCSTAFQMLLSKCLDEPKADLLGLDVTWHEPWDGILAAHPWLQGPESSYLGFTQRGGGASFEHSHGVDLLFVLADRLGALPLTDIHVKFDLRSPNADETANYFCSGKEGQPLSASQSIAGGNTEKRVAISFREISFSLEFGTDCDTLFAERDGQTVSKTTVPKSREEDFDAEVRFIRRALDKNDRESHLDVGKGLMSASLASSLGWFSTLGNSDEQIEIVKEMMSQEGIL